MTQDSEPRTVLVTGGCGFIGTNLVKFLYERGYKVKILDNLSTSARIWTADRGQPSAGETADPQLSQPPKL